MTVNTKSSFWTVPDIVELTVVVALPTLTLSPTNLTDPKVSVPIPAISVLNDVFNTLISWSFSYFSVGVNTKVFLSGSDSAENSPKEPPE